MMKKIIRILKKIMISFAIFIVVLLVATLLFMQQEKFGRKPNGERLARIQASPNFRDGAFQNEHPTPALTEGVTYPALLKEFFFKKKQRPKPLDTIPSIKHDIHTLPLNEDLLIWFGHSSYYMQVDGKKILVDPVFSGAASPLSSTVKAFKGADRYKVADLPTIDFLFITHDDWDHLDHETMRALSSKTNKVYCGLGVGSHLEEWGFETVQIVELDWNETASPTIGWQLNTVPARHFSGRGFTRNNTLWLSFALKTNTKNIFIGGDSGYDTHFAKAGATYGPFDLAILENGQYDKSWKYIHMMPNEVLQAGKDLVAKAVFPVHSSKFSLANHAWDDPLETISRLNEKEGIRLLTPIIGDVVYLNDSTRVFPTWWRNVE